MTVSEHANRANGSKVGSDDDRKVLKQGYFEVFNHSAAYVPPTPYFYSVDGRIMRLPISSGFFAIILIPQNQPAAFQAGEIKKTAEWCGQPRSQV